MTAGSRFNYDELVQEDRVHGSIYTDPDIFEEEMDKIFHRGWVYVGHASEIPEPGDYRLTWIGRQSVIMVRDASGQVQLLANRCAHRANSVCQTETGNANYFRCAYHGWTYKANGDLVGVPYSDGYGGSLKKEEIGLAKVPRVADYRGLIFGSLSPTGTSFEEHIPAVVRDQIDLFFDASPVGEIEVRSGVTKAYYYGNWKFVGMDGYHPEFTHQSTRPLARRQKITDAKGSDAYIRYQRDLGNGNVRIGAGLPNINTQPKMQHSPVPTTGGPELLTWMRHGDWRDDYERSMVEAYGPERAEFLIRERGDPHMAIFPNMQLISGTIRVMRPIAPGMTEIYMYAAQLKGVPKEMNARRLRQQEFSDSSAGFATPDDYEMFERNQVGLSNQINPWLLITRGLERQRTLEDGTILTDHSDEATQRSMSQRWKREMSQL